MLEGLQNVLHMRVASFVVAKLDDFITNLSQTSEGLAAVVTVGLNSE